MQVYFEDVHPGDELGPFVKEPSKEEVIAFARLAHLTGRFVDDEEARKEGMEGIIVSSWQSMAYLSQLLTNWMGPRGSLSKFDIYFRRIVEPGDRLECRAIVTDTLVKMEKHVVVLDIYIDNQKGERPLQGTAEVILPSRLS